MNPLGASLKATQLRGSMIGTSPIGSAYHLIKGQQPMTKDKTLRILAIEMEYLDAALADGKLTQAEYDEHVGIVHKWADQVMEEET
jgi:hypothetical protein